MGRTNILKYQKEHEIDHQPDKILGSPPNEPFLLTSNKTLPRIQPGDDVHNSFPFTLSEKSQLKDFLRNNKYYVESMNESHPEVFPLNSNGQSPHTLWIGCSDSRAGESCLHTLPGEVFTHRNIANVINANDISSQGIIQFAVDVLKVKKVIVCGHTDCGGIWASLSSKKIGGVLDLWLNPIRHVRANNIKTLTAIQEPKAKARKLGELNVINSVQALKRHPSALSAIKRGELQVWGLMYDVSSGLLNEIEIPEDEFEDLFHVDEIGDDEYNPH